jgi:hypothetical protein
MRRGEEGDACVSKPGVMEYLREVVRLGNLFGGVIWMWRWIFALNIEYSASYHYNDRRLNLMRRLEG